MSGNRLLGDPLKVRRRAMIATLALTLLNAFTYATSLQLLFGFTWLFVPVVALGIGYGDAFFVEHGRSVWRVVLQLIVAWTVGLASCSLLVIINSDVNSTLQRVVVSTLYGLVYGDAVIVLAAVVGLGMGRGIGYSARKIAEIDDDDW